MTDLEKMAREARLTDKHSGPWMVEYGYCKDEITAFAQAVAKRCAEICEAMGDGPFARGWDDTDYARAIRVEFGLKD